MPIIKKPEPDVEKHQTRIRISKDVYDAALAYYQWAELPSLDYLIEQSLLLTLKKDKEWHAQHKEKVAA